jgi:Tfp pilus assembly protein PilX
MLIGGGSMCSSCGEITRRALSLSLWLHGYDEMFASSQTKQKSGNQQRATNKATARNRYITKYNGARERAAAVLSTRVLLQKQFNLQC